MRKLITFPRGFQTHPPRKGNVLVHDKRAAACGSVKDNPRSARPAVASQIDLEAIGKTRNKRDPQLCPRYHFPAFRDSNFSTDNT